ncbi:MAG: hypothetical protein Q7R96_04875 [Nanoarchaeota archaeon]|nr:hypothetical protein [Nanoarchaeota archaeon]
MTNLTNPIIYERKRLDELYHLVIGEKKTVDNVEVEGLVYGLIFSGNPREFSVPRFILRDDVLLLRQGVKVPLVHHEHVAYVDCRREPDHQVFECFLRGVSEAELPIFVRGKALSEKERGMVDPHVYIKACEIIVDGITFKSIRVL